MESFEHLRRAHTVLLSTRRRNGRIVDTPVSVAIDTEGVGYFRTWSTAGKAKRLANFPGLRVAPCSRTGQGSSRSRGSRGSPGLDSPVDGMTPPVEPPLRPVEPPTGGATRQRGER